MRMESRVEHHLRDAFVPVYRGHPADVHAQAPGDGQGEGQPLAGWQTRIDVALREWLQSHPNL
ncbi:hypothetical protein GCM10025795_47530 [Verticiella sediminum]